MLMNTKVIEIKEYSNDNVGILIQVVLTEMTIIFAIMGLIDKTLLPIFYFVMSLLLLCMAYNNKKTYKRKYITAACLYVSIFVIISTILEYFV